MKREDFEPLVLTLWMTTRIPLTRAHLQFHSGLGRKKLNLWLDELVVEGVLEVDSDSDGQMVWTVPGAQRPLDGAETFAELQKRQAVRAAARAKARQRAGVELDPEKAASTALAVGNRAIRSLVKSGEGEKSLVAGAALGFLGPLGWLYSGALRETLPALGIGWLAYTLLPSFLLMPLLFVALPASALAGLAYAWKYNKNGERSTLILDDGHTKNKSAGKTSKK